MFSPFLDVDFMHSSFLKRIAWPTNGKRRVRDSLYGFGRGHAENSNAYRNGHVLGKHSATSPQLVESAVLTLSLSLTTTLSRKL